MRGSMMRIAVLLVTALVFGWIVQPTRAQLTMQFPVSRDVGIDGWDNHNGYGGVYDKALETEEFTNFGGIAPAVRGKKGTQHSLLMDWDTDAINQWIADNTNAGDTISWTLNIYPFGTPTDDVQIATLESINDWVEGDGPTNFTNFNWSEGTGAATQNFAVTYWTGDKELDVDRSIPWVDNDFGTGGIDDNQYSVLSRGDAFAAGDPIPDFINSVDLLTADLENADFDFTFASVLLDDDLISAILTDPVNRGIVFGPTNDGSVNSGNNWRIWSREGSGEVNDEGGPLLADTFPGPFAPFLEATVTAGPGAPLQPGDANQDLEFNQLDLVQVQQAAKYLTGQAATWGEGDWNGGPGGSPGNPPAGNGLFDQLDIVAALGAAVYLTGPYAAISDGGVAGDNQTSIGYNPSTGEVFVDAPAGTDLTSINIDSAAAIFSGEPAQNLGGSFDNDADNNIFKATFGSSFGSLSFGNVAQTGLAKDFVLNDLTVVGSLAGGGDLGNVDLIYVPEPATVLLLALGFLSLIGAGRSLGRR